MAGNDESKQAEEGGYGCDAYRAGKREAMQGEKTEQIARHNLFEPLPIGT